jgi:hypothetical protein
LCVSISQSPSPTVVCSSARFHVPPRPSATPNGVSWLSSSSVVQRRPTEPPPPVVCRFCESAGAVSFSRYAQRSCPRASKQRVRCREADGPLRDTPPKKKKLTSLQNGLESVVCACGEAWSARAVQGDVVCVVVSVRGRESEPFRQRVEGCPGGEHGVAGEAAGRGGGG